jgi:uncharacterized protein
MTLLLDVNLLLYAVFDSYQEHPMSLAWFEGIMNDPATLVGLPTASLLGFVRICTQSNPSFSRLTMSDALDQVEYWIEQPNVFIPQPAQDHIKRMANLLRLANGNHGLVADAHLAALAIEHRATLSSHDDDFTKFSGVAVLDPLQQQPPRRPI